MNRRTLLAGGAALALAGCSVNIAVELPRIQIDASRLTAWVVKKFQGTIVDPLVAQVKAWNARIQSYTVAGGWTPILKDVLAGFVVVMRAFVTAATALFPALGIPLTVVNIIGKVLTALGAFSSLMAAAGDPVTLDEADQHLATLEAV